jgi:hypothetical protein
MSRLRRLIAALALSAVVAVSAAACQDNQQAPPFDPCPAGQHYAWLANGYFECNGVKQ